MKFLSVRDLKSKSSSVWKDLSNQKDMVITSNGRPIAILSSITEDSNKFYRHSARPEQCKLSIPFNMNLRVKGLIKYLWMI